MGDGHLFNSHAQFLCTPIISHAHFYIQPSIQTFPFTGAADSVLLGAALHLAFPNETLRSINFGCPKIGNVAWSFWVDSLQPDRGGQHDNAVATGGGGSLEVFRFVNKIDLVPRLPELEFTHAGHTLQMSVGGAIRVRRCCFYFVLHGSVFMLI